MMALALLMAGCGGKKESTEGAEVHLLPDSIELVQANGKVMPENGLMAISTDISGTVAEVCVSEGDSVHKGEVLLRMDGRLAELKVQKAMAELQQKCANVKLMEASLQKAQEEYKVAEKLYRMSAALMEKGGESKSEMLKKEKESSAARQTVSESEAKLMVAMKEKSAAQQELDIAVREREEGNVKAPDDGRVLDIQADRGTAVQPYEQLATFAPAEPVVVEAEVDELFAPRLKVGQKVDIHLIGYSEVIAKGTIWKLMDYLSDKSIFSGLNAEQQDRQMRKVKILLDDQQHYPLLGTKVICDIHIK